jgi:hypothetical protein
VGEYWPFPQPAPHPVGLNFSTCHPCKNNNTRACLGFVGRGRLMWVVRVGFFSSILVSSTGQTNKHKLHNPTGNNIKPINNGKKKNKQKQKNDLDPFMKEV